MPTRNVNLTDLHDRLITKLVASGEYNNASEVVREGLRLLAERRKAHEAYVAWFKREVQKGLDQLDRGDFVSVPLDGIKEFIGASADQARRRVAARAKRQAQRHPIHGAGEGRPR
jgi:antitoxin ParD1/3/4